MRVSLAPIHVLSFAARLWLCPVQVLQSLEEAPGRRCDFRRECLVLVLISEREFGCEDAAFFALRPEDQRHGCRRGRGMVTLIGEVYSWPRKDSLKSFQAMDRRQCCLWSTRQAVAVYGEKP